MNHSVLGRGEFYKAQEGICAAGEYEYSRNLVYEDEVPFAEASPEMCYKIAEPGPENEAPGEYARD